MVLLRWQHRTAPLQTEQYHHGLATDAGHSIQLAEDVQSA